MKNYESINSKDEWNINQNWLDIITNLMISFINADFENDYESMYKSLRNIETQVSPTIDNTDIEKNLNNIRDKMDAMEQRDPDGNLVCYYPMAQREVQKLLHKTHSQILIMLDKKGILKKIQQDPRDAMGNFGGS